MAKIKEPRVKVHYHRTGPEAFEVIGQAVYEMRRKKGKRHTTECVRVA